MIAVHTICKTFGKLKVLDNVTLEIDKAGIYAILGPNGSGKTTFLKIILGMVIPDSGNILINGNTIAQSHEYRKDIGYLPQIAQFPENLTVKDVINMIRDIRNEFAEPEYLIELLGLKNYYNQKLATLSGGTKQKVNILLTFMFDSPVFILDEPTAGLDPVSLLKLKELLFKAKAAGKIILITSHIMNLMDELADEVIFLLEGRVYFHGSLASLKAQSNTKDLEHAMAAILQS